MTDEQLKALGKKELRLMIKDITQQRDDYMDSLGKLNSEVESLNETNRLLKLSVEKLNKSVRDEQSQNQILETNNSRLSEEIRLQTANKAVSATLQGIWSDIKNKFRKKFKKSKKLDSIDGSIITKTETANKRIQ